MIIYKITAWSVLGGFEYKINTSNGEHQGNTYGEQNYIESSDLYELRDFLTQEEELSEEAKLSINWIFIKICRDLNIDEDSFEIDYEELLKHNENWSL